MERKERKVTKKRKETRTVALLPKPPGDFFRMNTGFIT
jgi:hypothetical protein